MAIDLTVIIPNRNSIFATKTIQDVLAKAVTNVEVVVNVDENWPDPLVEDKRVTYIHPRSPRGMRWGINAGIALAKGKYIMKTDDHCMFRGRFRQDTYRKPQARQLGTNPAPLLTRCRKLEDK